MRSRCVDLSFLLRHIQVTGKSRLETHLCQLQCILLGLQIVTRHGELALKPAQIDIILGHFAEQRYENVAPVFHRHFDGRIRRLNAPAHAAKHVDFPIGVEPGPVKVLIQIGAAARGRYHGALSGRSEGILTGAIARVRTRHIDAGPGTGGGHHPRCPSLPDAGLRQAQIQIGLDRALHQRIQQRIIELGPPPS